MGVAGNGNWGWRSFLPATLTGSKPLADGLR